MVSELYKSASVHCCIRLLLTLGLIRLHTSCNLGSANGLRFIKARHVLSLLVSAMLPVGTKKKKQRTKTSINLPETVEHKQLGLVSCKPDLVDGVVHQSHLRIQDGIYALEVQQIVFVPRNNLMAVARRILRCCHLLRQHELVVFEVRGSHRGWAVWSREALDVSCPKPHLHAAVERRSHVGKKRMIREARLRRQAQEVNGIHGLGNARQTGT